MEVKGADLIKITVIGSGIAGLMIASLMIMYLLIVFNFGIIFIPTVILQNGGNQNEPESRRDF
ncbi:hypothetical protein GCM10011346_19600 [Oceanobacillus neutriphilus]|uniref:Uncharacterized protein n=1 Tax=Oceanobacillus neutriphilus TaxID=531815 RepID=A0ABQ2NU90_9BACI|nr:hypothetical protein GCM10011346_19600 [Oceanobacillus neutriphilus]